MSMYSQGAPANYKLEMEENRKWLDKEIGKIAGVIKTKDEKFGSMHNFKKDGEWYTQGDETFDLLLEAKGVNTTIKKLKWTSHHETWAQYLGCEKESEGVYVTHWKISSHIVNTGFARHKAKVEGYDFRIPEWLR